MAQTSLGSLSQAQVFPCQNCREIINVSMSNCPNCGVAINADAAQVAADNQAKVAEACSNANYLKTMGRAMVGFFLVSLIPYIGGFGNWGFLAMLILIPILVIRWWVKYRNLQTADPDFEGARRDTIVAFAIWSIMVVVWLVVGILWVLLINTAG